MHLLNVGARTEPSATLLNIDASVYIQKTIISFSRENFGKKSLHGQLNSNLLTHLLKAIETIVSCISYEPALGEDVDDIMHPQDPVTSGLRDPLPSHAR